MNGNANPNDTVKHAEIDLKKELEMAHEDEESDVEKYMKLAAYADEHHPRCGYGQILRDIAKEESQHRKHIKMILEDMDKRAGETHE